MKLILSLACEKARARPDGRLDVVGAFDHLQAPGFPAAQSRMTVVFVMEWTRAELGRQEFTADLVDRADRKVLTIEGATEVSAPAEAGPPPQTRLVMELERVVFPEPGTYRFMLRAGGSTHAAFALHLSERVESGRTQRPGPG